MPQTSTRAPRGPYRKTHIVRHGYGWKYHRSIPRDLREIFGGKTTWTRYLGKDRSKAENSAHEEDAKYGKLILSWRALTDGERAQIIAAGGIESFKSRATSDEPGLGFLQAVADLEWSADTTEATEDDLAQSALMILQSRLQVTQAREKKQKAKKLAAKLDGETGGAKLMSLVDLWERVRRPRSYKAAEKTRLYMRRFNEIVGDMEPRTVTRTHVIKFREALESKGYSASNITQHLDKIHTIFNVALSEGELESNPAYKIKARKDARKLSDRRQDFTSAHVRTILTKAKDEREDFAWILRLLAYHGARSGEICQLRCDDMATLHGVDVFRIHDRYGRVKNKASIRDVPIHPKCKGIVAYAKRIVAKHGADAWLFPELPKSKQSRAHGFQNYCSNTFLRQTCGIKERHYTLHSLRHTWRTLARELSMPEAVSRSLMGHSLGRDDHAGYGAGPSLALRAEWLKKIDPLKG